MVRFFSPQGINISITANTNYPPQGLLTEDLTPFENFMQYEDDADMLYEDDIIMEYE